MATKPIARVSPFYPAVFDDFFKTFNQWPGNGGYPERMLTTPAVNVSEDKDRYNLSLAAPGLQKEDFRIDVEGNMLTISSEKEETKEDDTEKYNRREYSYASFSRSFSLPEEVKTDAIEAKYADGVLQVILPKKESTQADIAKKIAVK